MKVSVSVNIDHHVRDRAARQLVERGLTIDEAINSLFEQLAAGLVPEFEALSPNATTVAAIEAVRRGEVVEIGTPNEVLAELNSDD